MTNNVNFRKVLVIGIIVLFVGASFIPNVSSDTLELENIDFNKKPTKLTNFVEPYWLWASSGGGSEIDYGTDIRIECFGNSYEVGCFKGTAYFGSTTLTSNGNYDFYVAKMDSSGNWEWAINGGSNGADYAYGIEVDYDWNSYITGKFQGTAYFGSTALTSNGSYDVFVAKIDSSGNWQWAKSAGGSAGDQGNNIYVDTYANSYITGEFQDTADFGSTELISNGGSDVFVAKIDSSGDWEWAKSAGGSDTDTGYGIYMKSSDNSYITGIFKGTADFGSTAIISSGGSDVFVAKIDNSGDWEWAKSAGGSDTDTGYGIFVDASDYSYITGEFQGTADFGSTDLISSGGSDVFVAKIDSSGDWEWAKSAGGSDTDTGYGIYVLSDNSYITGEFQDTADFGSTDLISSGGSDVFVAKIDSSGDWEWAISGGGTSDERGKSIGKDSNGILYIIGNFYGNANFGSTALTSSGQSDVFVASLDQDYGGENNPPYEPSDPMPDDGATDVDINTDLSWTGGDPDEGDTVVYDVYLEANNPDPEILVSDHQSETSFDPGTMDYDTVYYWRIKAIDNHNRVTKGPVWHFTTEDLQNEPPDAPTITGKINGKAGVEYEYTFNAVDPDGDDVKYYIDWDDGDSDTTAFSSSGTNVKVKHTWSTQGTYIIKAKAEDTNGLESDWAELSVTMPRNKAISRPFLQFLENYPHMFPILRLLFQRLGLQ